MSSDDFHTEMELYGVSPDIIAMVQYATGSVMVEIWTTQEEE